MASVSIADHDGTTDDRGPYDRGTADGRAPGGPDQ